MRKSFLEAYRNPEIIVENKQILSTPPISQQQRFIQVIGNLVLLHRGKEVENATQIFDSYVGSYSSLVLKQKYVGTSIEKRIVLVDYEKFVILRLLGRWVHIVEDLKKKKQVRLYPTIVESLQKGKMSYEQLITYVNFISLEIISILKPKEQKNNRPVFDELDLLRFLRAILPNILINLSVPSNFFPNTLIKSSQPSINVLYCNQNLQNCILQKKNYLRLLTLIFELLLQSHLNPNESKELLLLSFNFFYIAHLNVLLMAKEVVIQAFEKINSAVRFAMHEEILRFISCLEKIDQEQFISQLADKFEWISQILEEVPRAMGINKANFKPFFTNNIKKSLQIKIQPKETQRRYIQIYQNFSLIYFSLNCIEYNITIRFFFLGDFDNQDAQQNKKLLFASEKRQGIFQGSIEAIERGIYMFEFDNSYSWMKSKVVEYDTSVWVPMEIGASQQLPVKKIIYGEGSKGNKINEKKRMSWSDANEIKLQASSCQVSQYEENGIRTFRLKMTKNFGAIYEFESQSIQRFLLKLQSLEKEPKIFWVIRDKKATSIQQVKNWIHSYERVNSPLKLHKSSTDIIKREQKKQSKQEESKVNIQHTD